MKQFSKLSSKKYYSPLTSMYWKNSCKELKSAFMWVFSANIVSVRILLESLSIPVPFSDNLYISFSFLFSALGSFIYGPTLAIITGFATDVLGYIISPKGPYYFPFTLLEVLSSLIFALFLYGSKLSRLRLILSKLSVNIVINIILTPIFLNFMYGQASFVFFVVRLLKNLIILPFEILLMLIFFRAIIPICHRFGLISFDKFYASGNFKSNK